MLPDITEDLRILKALCTLAESKQGQTLLEFLQGGFMETARTLAHDITGTTAQAYKMHGYMQCLDELIFQLRNASANYKTARLTAGLDVEHRGGNNNPEPGGTPATEDFR